MISMNLHWILLSIISRWVTKPYTTGVYPTCRGFLTCNS